MNNLYVLLFSLFTVSVISQKLPDISIEMLEQTTHRDSTAPAAYLIHNCSVEFMFLSDKIFLTYTVKERIKIYEEKGMSYADFSIPLYGEGGNKELVSKIKAKTYNLINGKIEKTDLKRKKDVYREESSKYWSQVKFAMPNVKAGSIIDVEYTVRSPFIYEMDRWYFQEPLPVDYSLFKIRIPKYFSYTPVPKGTTLMESSKDEVLGSDHGEMEYLYVGKNIPAIKDDEFVLNKNDYRSSIKFELYYTQFPNQIIKYYSKDWTEISSQLLQSKTFGKEIRRKLNDLNFDHASINSLPREDKIKAAYDYVRTEYTWNGNYGITSRQGLKKLTETKTGSIGDINLLLLNILHKCEIDSHPIVGKSRDSGLLNEHYPTLTDLNYVMAYIPESDGSYMLLDATCPFSPMGQIPRRALNTTGVLVMEDIGQVIHLENKNKYATSTMSTYEIDTENIELVGDSKRKHSGYSAWKYRLDQSKKDKSTSTESSTDDPEEENIEVRNEYSIIDVKNPNDVYSNVEQEYSEIIREEISKIGSNFFIDAAIDFGIDENPFKEKTRQYPVFYSYPLDLKTVITIKIPEGYQVESIPESIALSLPEKSATFRYNVQQNEKEIMIYYFFTIDKDLFLAKEYPDLKEFYNRVIQKGTEKFVLAKKV